MWARDHQVGPVEFRFLGLYGVFQGPRELPELEEGKNYSTPFSSTDATFCSLWLPLVVENIHIWDNALKNTYLISNPDL